MRKWRWWRAGKDLLLVLGTVGQRDGLHVLPRRVWADHNGGGHGAQVWGEGTGRHSAPKEIVSMLRMVAVVEYSM
ncbi:hypothetical protein EDB84DRAFT_1492671, partial [Lactarius hengduanensis]